MATSHRLSRGFHRLALVLAAIPLVVGGYFYFVVALDRAETAKRQHDEQVKLACAQSKLKSGGHLDSTLLAGAFPLCPPNCPPRGQGGTLGGLSGLPGIKTFQLSAGSRFSEPRKGAVRFAPKSRHSSAHLAGPLCADVAPGLCRPSGVC